MVELKGAVAVITGGSVGIGAVYVRDLLKNGVAHVAVLDVNVAGGEELVSRLNGEFGADKVKFFKCDVTNRTEFEAAFKATLDSKKKVDILINNAGIMNDGCWEKEIAINMHGVIHGIHIGMQHMGKGGTIVNIASILGLAPLAGCPIYVGTKHAVIGMTKSWAMPFHYNKTGIRMMAMCPGVTDTDLISGAGQRQQNEHVSSECDRELSSLKKQPPQHVADGMMHMLKNGENGSIWVSEGGEPIYEVDIPARDQMRKKR